MGSRALSARGRRRASRARRTRCSMYSVVSQPPRGAQHRQTSHLGRCARLARLGGVDDDVAVGDLDAPTQHRRAGAAWGGVSGAQSAEQQNPSALGNGGYWATWTSKTVAGEFLAPPTLPTMLPRNFVPGMPITDSDHSTQEPSSSLNLEPWNLQVMHGPEPSSCAWMQE
jgi:hypothetical protein